MKRVDLLFSLVRVVLGIIFFWAFIDKLYGLGYATATEKSWLAGESPTAGFLKFGTHGPFATFFQGLAGNPFVDWLFMMGLLFVGLSLLLGIGMKIAGYSGALMMGLIYLSLFPPENNPLIDEHIIYILLFIIFSKGEVGHRFSLNSWWKKMGLVKKYAMLQ